MEKASFNVSRAAWLVMIAAIVLPWANPPSHYAGESLIVPGALGLIFGSVAQLVSLGLGVGGLIQKEKKKTLAIRGTLLSLIWVVLVLTAPLWDDLV